MLLKELTEMRARLVKMREDARSSMRHSERARNNLSTSYFNGEGVAFQRVISMIDEVISKREFLYGESHVPENMCYNICADCEVGECEGK